jgi:hypothetical protein
MIVGIESEVMSESITNYYSSVLLVHAVGRMDSQKVLWSDNAILVYFSCLFLCVP